MPLHSSPQFGPAYSVFQNFAMGGLHGPNSEAPLHGTGPATGFGMPQMPPSDMSSLRAATGGVYAPLSASHSHALTASASLCLAA